MIEDIGVLVTDQPMTTIYYEMNNGGIINNPGYECRNQERPSQN